MCQPFSFRAVETSPRSLSRVVGTRRGCGASLLVQLRGPPADCGIPRAAVRWASAPSPVVPVRDGMW